MAKKIFKPQIKSLFLFNISYLYFIIFALAIIIVEAIYFYNINPAVILIIIPAFLIVKYMLKPAMEELDIGGYDEIAVDSENKFIQFDNKEIIRFDDVSYIYLKLYKHNHISATMMDSIISLISVNSELLIGLKRKDPIFIYIQRRDCLLKLLKELQKHKEIRLKFDESYNGYMSHQFPMFLFIMIIAAILFIWKVNF